MRPEAELRAAIVAEARSWLLTPWHHESCLKGVGVDCANLLKGVYVNAGAVRPFPIAHYPPDWMLHQDQPLFVQILSDFCAPVNRALPADIVMFRVGRHPAHAGIVLNDELMIHAFKNEGCVTISSIMKTPQAGEFAGYWRWQGFL